MARPEPNPITARPRAVRPLLIVMTMLVVGFAFAPALRPVPRQPADTGPLYRIAINHAPATELVLLPGVGPALAERIIAARAERPFTDPADLRRVSGIGEKLPDRIAPHVTFEP